jgi:catechol 2,3-dioxygenase-like lactoylglutathione lyase family enzyme
MKVLSFGLMWSLLLFGQPARPHILGLAHVSISVSDLGKARTFYEGFLGFGELVSLNQHNGAAAVTVVKVNDYQYIEITTGLKPDEDRLSQVSFYTDDATGMRLYLASRRVVVPDELHEGPTGDRGFTFKDPEAHTIEMLQYTPNGTAMKEKGTFMPDTRISRHIDHVGLVVGNGRAALRFYHDILGFEERLRGSSSGTVLSWINMRVPDGNDGVEFMLFGNVPPPGERGMAHHLCLEVASVPSAVTILKSRPYAKGYDRPFEIVTGSNRRRHVNLFDPDGTRTELMESFTVDGRPAISSDAPLPR